MKRRRAVPLKLLSIVEMINNDVIKQTTEKVVFFTNIIDILCVFV